MISLRTHRFDLPLRHTFTIARESREFQPTMIVELSDGEHSGFGEATTSTYYNATYERMQAALDRVLPIVESADPDDPSSLWDALVPQLRDDPFAHCALDEAAHDLWGKRQGKPLYQLWGLDPQAGPPSNFTIGIAEIDVMVDKLQSEPGWPVYKIKLGTPNDLEIVRRLREVTSAGFRVDANCAWTADETIANSEALRELDVEFIEQPLPADRWDEMERVYRQSALPIVADESCICPEDVARCQGYFHGVNIKLMKCGGLTPARRMIDEAKSLGLNVMVGCMTESTVGISAIAQLLPLLDYVDMDGACLLAHDIANGARVVRGRCEFPALGGCGVELLQETMLRNDKS